MKLRDLIPGLFASAGCAAGEGTIEVRIWGETYIEEGIPADVMIDGWAIDFDRAEVELRNVTVAGTDVVVEAPFDLSIASEGIGQSLGTVRVPASEQIDIEYTVVRVTLEGSANKGEVTKIFSWDFDTPVHYFDCETTEQVPADGTGEVQITLHADHLFFDSFVSMAPAMRFEPLAAADTDADDVITMAELAATDIGPYDPGNLHIDDFWAFLSAQIAAMGHVDGEGYCASSPE